VTVDWATLASGLVGAVLGAGGAVTTTLITTRSDRAARKADREEDRNDRAGEHQQERAGRRADQGRTAARDILAITSQFFTNTVSPAGTVRGDTFIGDAGWDAMRRIDDLAELIDSEDVREAVRAIINAVGTVNFVTLLAQEYGDVEQGDRPTRRRERALLLLLRRTVGTYLRDEEDQYAALLTEAKTEEDTGEYARLELDPTTER
jgi:hypothetical protein